MTDQEKKDNYIAALKSRLRTYQNDIPIAQKHIEQQKAAIADHEKEIANREIYIADKIKQVDNLQTEIKNLNEN